MKRILLPACMIVFAPMAQAADFELKFSSWGGIPLCSSGQPGMVGNPSFQLNNLPEGTTSVQLRLKDLDVPGYNHGGSKRLNIREDGRIAAGTFRYKSPCPPSGVHTYEWTATARKGGKSLGSASARRRYPD